MKTTEIEVKECLAYTDRGRKVSFWCPFLSVTEDGTFCQFYKIGDAEEREINKIDDDLPGEKPDFCHVTKITVEEEGE